MEIRIGFGQNNKSKTNPHNQNEYNYLNLFIEKLSEHFNIDNFHIESNSNDYLTLKYKLLDIVRIKYTDYAKWISIYISSESKKDNINNPLFEKETNKNKVHWKSDFNGSIQPYLSILIKSCQQIDNFN